MLTQGGRWELCSGFYITTGKAIFKEGSVLLTAGTGFSSIKAGLGRGIRRKGWAAPETSRLVGCGAFFLHFSPIGVSACIFRGRDVGHLR